MSPYWDNKALPTPTLPNNFIFNFLIIQFLLKINAFWDLKMEKKVWRKADSNSKIRIFDAVDRVKKLTPFHLFYATETDPE